MNSVAVDRDLDVYMYLCGILATLLASGYLAKSGGAVVLVCLLSSFLTDLHVTIFLYSCLW